MSELLNALRREAYTANYGEDGSTVNPLERARSWVVACLLGKGEVQKKVSPHDAYVLATNALVVALKKADRADYRAEIEFALEVRS